MKEWFKNLSKWLAFTVVPFVMPFMLAACGVGFAQDSSYGLFMGGQGW